MEEKKFGADYLDELISDMARDLVGGAISETAARLKLGENTIYCMINRNKPQIPNMKQFFMMLAEADSGARNRVIKEFCRVFRHAAVRLNGDLAGMLRELAGEIEGAADGGRRAFLRDSSTFKVQSSKLKRGQVDG